MSSFYIVLLTHGSERCALQKQENIIVLILRVWKLALESWFEARVTLEMLMTSSVPSSPSRSSLCPPTCLSRSESTSRSLMCGHVLTLYLLH